VLAAVAGRHPGSIVGKGKTMRYLIRTVLLFACLGTAHALTPPPDNSPGLFAGEWAGNGEHGGYCYLKLGADGSGWVLIDGGAGDWLGARMQWHNQRQALQVDKIIPLVASARLRVMPLEKFLLGSGFNQSLKLTWNEQSAGCQLQKVDTTARHLDRARNAIEGLLSDERR
jgi:hypothetical protein